ncbi:MAG: hypothetical protein FJX23_01720 [Alphaproteobacteria bacterium]|nr:hypothetical protein [Alphaproteobacteria bacterium]
MGNPFGKMTSNIWKAAILHALLCVFMLLPLGEAWATNQSLLNDFPNYRNYEDRKAGRWEGGASFEGTDVHPFMFIPGFHSPGNPIMQVGGKTVRELDPDTGITRNVAFSAICSDGVFIERIVRCVQAIILESVETFLTSFRTSLQAFVLGCIILAVTFFGMSILLGTCRNPGPESFTLLLKIGGVLLFTGIAETMLLNVFGIMETLAGIASSYLTSDGMTYQDLSGAQVTVDGFITSCGADSAQFGSNIWGKIDCIMARLFLGDEGTGLKVGLLWTIGAALFWTSFIGPFVFLVLLMVMLMLSLLVMRCVFTFLATYAMLGLLVIISPLIIPLVLFNTARTYFDSWLRLVIGTIIQPMVLFSFMVFAFAVMDTLFFQDNEHSLTAILGVGWEEPKWGPVLPVEFQEELLERYQEENPAQGPGTPGYNAFERTISRPMDVVAIGNVRLVKEPLLNIHMRPLSEEGSGVPVIGGLVDEAGEVVNDVVDFGFGKIQELICPFDVIRLESNVDHTGTLVYDLMKFFLFSLFLMYLMKNFAERIPQLVSDISQSRMQMLGQYLPVERQVRGVISGTRHAVKEGVVGAAKGFLSGGKKGAIVGAAQGVVKGVQSGYEKGSGQKLSRYNPIRNVNDALGSFDAGKDSFSAGFEKAAGKKAGAMAKGGAAKLLTKLK